MATVRWNHELFVPFVSLFPLEVVDTMVGADQAKLRQLVAEWARD